MKQWEKIVLGGRGLYGLREREKQRKKSSLLITPPFSAVLSSSFSSSAVHHTTPSLPFSSIFSHFPSLLFSLNLSLTLPPVNQFTLEIYPSIPALQPEARWIRLASPEMKARVCELCNEEASLYCASDSAFLCWGCDARVHGANFLVARHVRSSLCSECKGFTSDTFSGVGLQRRRPICGSCLSETSSHLDSMSSSSSSCVSTTESGPKNGSSSRRKAEAASRSSRRRRTSIVSAEAEGILVNWCRKLGLNGNCATAAVDALGACLNKFTLLPPQVSLAAAAWCGAKLSGDRSAYTYQNLKRLAAISGVPAKLILAAQSKLARAMRMERPPHVHDQEEGWAECS